MVVFPHPDDETMAAGGLLLAAKRLGWQTVVVILTHGEAGQIHTHPRGRSLRAIRAAELLTAARRLGVDQLVTADFGDGKLRQTRPRWSKWLARHLVKFNPGWVVTYDHSGLTGHPDHIVLSLESVARINKGAKLWWSTVSEELVDKWRGKLIHSGVADLISPPTHVLDLSWGQWWRKYRAATAHRSQRLKPVSWMPLWLVMLQLKREWYHEVDLKKKYPYKFVDFKI